MKYLFLSAFLFLSGALAQGLPEDSIYLLESKWKTPDNKVVTLETFKGQPVIIGMVYTQCPHACPMTINKIQKMESEFKKIGKKNYKVVLASFDVKRDTPEHLKKYAVSRNLGSNWTFLSADKEGTARELSVLLGISYKEIEGGEFAHSNVITLLDKNGVIKAKVESLSADHAPIVNQMKSL